MSTSFPSPPGGGDDDDNLLERGQGADSEGWSDEEDDAEVVVDSEDRITGKKRNRTNEQELKHARLIAERRLGKSNDPAHRLLLSRVNNFVGPVVAAEVRAQPLPLTSGVPADSAEGRSATMDTTPSEPASNPLVPVPIIDPIVTVPLVIPSHTPTSPIVIEDPSVLAVPSKEESKKSDGAPVNTINIPPPSLTFYFMDVGQGNGTLIMCPDGQTILVDLGCVSGTVHGEGKYESFNVRQYVTKKVGTFLNDITGKKLDYLVITHGDQDHLNLIKPVLEGYEVETVICGGSSKQYYGRLGEGLTKKAKYLSDEAHYSFYTEDPDTPNQTFKVNDVDIFIVGANAPGDHSNKKDQSSEKADIAGLGDFLEGDERFDEDGKSTINPGTDTNASSIVLLFRYKKVQVIISADATYSSEYCILARKESKWKPEHLDSYALIGGHHGSSDSFSRKWLRAVNPAWVLFGADLKDSYAHPTTTVIKRVLEICTYLKDPTYEAWGLHGVIAGCRVAKPEDLLALEDQLSKVLGDTLPAITKLQALKSSYDAYPDPTLVTKKFPWYGKLPLPLGWMLALTAFVQIEQPISRLLLGNMQPLTTFSEIWADLERARIATPEEIGKGRTEAIFKWYVEDLDKNPPTGGLPPLVYWADQLRRFEEEIVRVNKLRPDLLAADKNVTSKGHYAVWNWSVTRHNLFTTMESSQSGVYWMLEIDGYGVAHTRRM